MSVTVIRAIVNMNSSFTVSLVQRRPDDPPPGERIDDALPPNSVSSFDTLRCDIPVPWCRSWEEFSNSIHLRLSFFATRGLGPIRESQFYTIWQQDINGVDLVRFSLNGYYIENAPGLAAYRVGHPAYNSRHNSDAILVVDERAWVILTRIIGWE
jgi:hypothetical protein